GSSTTPCGCGASIPTWWRCAPSASRSFISTCCSPPWWSTGCWPAWRGRHDRPVGGRVPPAPARQELGARGRAPGTGPAVLPRHPGQDRGQRLVKPRRANALTVLGACAVILAMVGLTAASVPLYRLFCQVTGYGGTTQVARQAPGASELPAITVRFDAEVDPTLPWRFQPVEHEVVVRPGEQRLAFYEATNLADHPVVGRATFNVTPHKVGGYFDKLQCFCFDEQTLAPHATAQLAVSFFVDPALLADADTREVRDITLSYTFFIDR